MLSGIDTVLTFSREKWWCLGVQDQHASLQAVLGSCPPESIDRDNCLTLCNGMDPDPDLKHLVPVKQQHKVVWSIFEEYPLRQP